jgi:hypothetical protein
LHVNPVIQANDHPPLIAPDVPVARRPVAPERSTADSRDQRHDRDFAAASRAQHTAAARSGRGHRDNARALVEADLNLRAIPSRTGPIGPSLPFLVQTLAQEVVPEHEYQQANAQGAGTRAYEAANDRIATVFGPDYPFDRRV